MLTVTWRSAAAGRLRDRLSNQAIGRSERKRYNGTTYMATSKGAL